jgi:GNAT superfamily N-acetyltransferase
VGVGLIGPEGDPGWWRVRGMATLPEARGRGAGTAVLNALLDHARSQEAVGVWASVRVPARSLYERAGFVTVSDEFEPPHIGPHVIMSRELEGREGF